MKFPDNNEFNFIKQMLLGQKTTDANLILGPGDDCAQLNDWLITTDISVEGTHYRLDWSSLTQAIHKCVLSNLSDINAMGGQSEWALLGLCLRSDWGADQKNEVVRALGQILQRHQVGVMGGDTVSAALSSFQLTIMGRTPGGYKPLLRSGAQVGQYVYVSGKLGASKAGLWALLHGLESTYPEAVAQHLVPDPPLGLGPRLHECEVGACIDISDGLSSELNHIALQSGVKIAIDAAKIPRWEGLQALCAKHNLLESEFVLHGGEEYQLLFTSNLHERVIISKLKEYNVTCIGKVIEGVGVVIKDENNGWNTILPEAWSNL